MSKNIGGLDIDAVAEALVALVDKQGEKLDVILAQKLRREIAGTVGRDLDFHRFLPFCKILRYYCLLYPVKKTCQELAGQKSILRRGCIPARDIVY